MFHLADCDFYHWLRREAVNYGKDSLPWELLLISICCVAEWKVHETSMTMKKWMRQDGAPWWCHFCHVFVNMSLLTSFLDQDPMIAICTQRPLLDHFIVGIQHMDSWPSEFKLFSWRVWFYGLMEITFVLQDHKNIREKMLLLCIFFESSPISRDQQFWKLLHVKMLQIVPVHLYQSITVLIYLSFAYHAFQIWTSFQ